MNCHEFIDFIMEYLDGELPEEQRAIFEQHIALGVVDRPIDQFLDPVEAAPRLVNLRAGVDAQPVQQMSL